VICIDVDEVEIAVGKGRNRIGRIRLVQPTDGITARGQEGSAEKSMMIEISG